MSGRAGSRQPSSPPKRPIAGGRPLIGVTGHRLRQGEGNPDFLIGAGEPYLAAVRRAGGLPVVLDPATAEAPGGLETILDRVDGLLFTGGQDIDPAHYGEAVLNETVTLEPERDAFELPLLRAAVRGDLPVLAICRGCQVLNVALGGTLWQDLPAQRPDGLPHRQREARDAVTHAVRVAPGTLLARVVGEGPAARLPTNTFHHQAARDVPPALVASAFCTDGTVEALEAPGNRFVLGVQWHPERLAAGWPEHHRLFGALVDAAAHWAQAPTGRLRRTA